MTSKGQPMTNTRTIAIALILLPLILGCGSPFPRSVKEVSVKGHRVEVATNVNEGAGPWRLWARSDGDILKSGTVECSLRKQSQVSTGAEVALVSIHQVEEIYEIDSVYDRGQGWLYEWTVRDIFSEEPPRDIPRGKYWLCIVYTTADYEIVVDDIPFWYGRQWRWYP
jgi:hypothetical protein